MCDCSGHLVFPLFWMTMAPCSSQMRPNVISYFRTDILVIRHTAIIGTCVWWQGKLHAGLHHPAMSCVNWACSYMYIGKSGHQSQPFWSIAIHVAECMMHAFVLFCFFCVFFFFVSFWCLPPLSFAVTARFMSSVHTMPVGWLIKNDPKRPSLNLLHNQRSGLSDCGVPVLPTA